MQNLLKIYIEKFVLCKQCHLPETHYKIKTQMINQSCKACGAKEPIDMTHKLCTFILKHSLAKKEEKKKESDKPEKSESSNNLAGIEKEKKLKKSKKVETDGSNDEGECNNSAPRLPSSPSSSALPPQPPTPNVKSPTKSSAGEDISDSVALGK